MAYTHYYDKTNMFHGSLPLIMGTRLDALLIGTDKTHALAIWEKVVFELNRLHKMFNRFDPQSELSQISRQAITKPVKVKDEMWDILSDCKRYHSLTLGYFDITLTDYAQVNFNKSDRTVSFDGKQFMLDLGGYAKGYALVKLQNLLKTSGISQAFINFGNSSVLAIGKHPHGEPWSVGINNPFSPEQILETVELADNSLSTSGNMPHHSQHIVNPLTGEFTSERKLVSVVAKNALDAEVLTTALMVADEQSADLIKENFQNTTNYTFRLT